MAQILMANDAEGMVDGATITIANSGGISGDPFSNVTIGSGGSAIATSAATLLGQRSYLITQSATEQTHVGWSWTAAWADFSAEILFSISAAPAVTATILRGYSGAGYTPQIFSVSITQTKRIQLIHTPTNTVVTSPSVAAEYIEPNTPYVLRFRSNGNEGVMEATVYPLGSATERTSVTMTGLTLAATNSVRIGITTASAIFGLKFEPRLSIDGYMPRLDMEANVAPVANLGANVTGIEPYSTALLSGENSYDSDGTISVYSFSQTGGTPTVTLTGTGASRSYKAPGTLAGTTLTFSLTVTDNQGKLSATDTVTHTILPATEWATKVVNGVNTFVPMEIYRV